MPTGFLGHSSIGGSLYPFVATSLSSSGTLAVIGSKKTGGVQRPDTIPPTESWPIIRQTLDSLYIICVCVCGGWEME